MPQLGETVTEGTVVRWLKSVGDHVERDEPLLEVSTDKVDTEVPSAEAGTLVRIAVAEGETVPIGAVLCTIGEDGDEPAGESDASAGSRRSVRDALVGHQARLDERPPVAPPSARRSVRPPSGAPAGTPGAAARGTPGAPTAPPPPLPDLPVAERIPFTTARRRTAAHLRGAVDTAVHTLTTTSVDYTAVEAVRRPAGLSHLPFVARAVCDALTAFPRLNASVGDDELVVWARVHLGVAVDLGAEGLVVPVLRDAPDLRLAELGQRLRDLADRARAHQLGADDLAGGTFTITNAGRYGTVVTTPVIHTPQVAILSMDGIGPRPVAVADGDGWAVAVKVCGNLSLSFDHAAIDGAEASAFLAEVRTILETRDWDAELGARP